MKNFLIILFFLSANSVCIAQQKLSFSSQTYAGIVTGEAMTDLQLQTINGVKWNKWFAGAGAGIDWYYLRSVPVFASVNRSIFQKGKRSFFVAGDVGINIPWEQETYYYIWDVPDVKQSPGLYWGGGVGYRFGVGKADNAILLQLGYSYKQMKEKVSSTVLCLIPPCPVNTETYDYRLKRLSLRLGWGF